MGAYLPNIDELMSLGINPKTHLPYKFENCVSSQEGIKKLLRVIDEQDAVNRYHWIGLPKGLTSEIIERVLYYRGRGVFFYVPATAAFYFLPCSQINGLDVYGRAKNIRPLCFHGAAEEKEKVFIPGLELDPLYEINTEEDFDPKNKCVVLYDYVKQYSQTIIPRKDLQEPLLDVMSECIPLMETRMIATCGVAGWRVPDNDAKEEAINASNAIKDAALKGKIFIPIESEQAMQAMNPAGSTAGTAEYMLAMQSLDNFRLGCYGLENGGLFEKKAHMLNSEEALNGQTAGIIYNDGLRLRQEFCDIVNSIWEIGIWCEPSENVIAQDYNGDGVIADSPEETIQEGGNPDNDVEQDI